MKAETSITVFGLYMVGIGVGLMVVPQGLTALFGLGTADVGWTRLVGLLATLLGWYYIQASRAAFTPFLRWTIPARLFAALFMGALSVWERCARCFCYLQQSIQQEHFGRGVV